MRRRRRRIITLKGAILDCFTISSPGNDCFFVGGLVAYRPSNKLVYLRDGSALTILRAATLR